MININSYTRCDYKILKIKDATILCYVTGKIGKCLKMMKIEIFIFNKLLF